MPKPLRSEDPNPKSVQFSHFGVLNDGDRSKGALATSLVTNVVVLLFVIIVGSVVKKAVLKEPPKNLTYVKVEPPPEVKPPPPPPPVKLPPVPHVEPPKVAIEKPIPPPPEIKPVEVPQPKPFVPAPAPRKVSPPPGPVAVHLPTSAAVPNHDAHPSAVKLGQADSPIKSLTGPAVANVNLGNQGIPGMSKGNTGNGPHATAVNLGGGCPNCQDLNGRGKGAVRVVGLGNGMQGGAGKAPYRPGVTAVQVPMQQAQVQPTRPSVVASTAASAPVVTYKPQPVYTAEAKAMHLEGNVSVRIRVQPTGAVDVLGIVHGLGHGLDESAETACRGTRFKPAVDASGRPVAWEGVVLVRFQMS